MTPTEPTVVVLALTAGQLDWAAHYLRTSGSCRIIVGDEIRVDLTVGTGHDVQILPMVTAPRQMEEEVSTHRDRWNASLDTREHADLWQIARNMGLCHHDNPADWTTERLVEHIRHFARLERDIHGS